MKNLKQKTLVFAALIAFLFPFNSYSQANNKNRNSHHQNMQHKKPNRNHTPYSHHHKPYKRPQHRPKYRPQYKPQCQPRHHYYRPHPARTVYRQVVVYGMAPQIYQSLQLNMHSAYFDNERLEIAKIAIAGNGVNTNQVIDLMSKLSFDKNRLELAKFAYDYVIDPEQYFRVVESLSFYSNRRALTDYIR